MKPQSVPEYKHITLDVADPVRIHVSIPNDTKVIVSPTCSLDSLTHHLNKDEGYAWSWQSNIAVPIADALFKLIEEGKLSTVFAQSHLRHRWSNEVAAILMKHLFDVDMGSNSLYMGVLQKVAAIELDEVNNIGEWSDVTGRNNSNLLMTTNLDESDRSILGIAENPNKLVGADGSVSITTGRVSMDKPSEGNAPKSSDGVEELSPSDEVGIKDQSYGVSKDFLDVADKDAPIADPGSAPEHEAPEDVEPPQPHPNYVVAVFNSGNSSFHVDDGCYVLTNKIDDTWVIASHLFPEAISILAALPKDPKDAAYDDSIPETLEPEHEAPEESNLVKHAKREFLALGYKPIAECEENPDKWIQENVIELLEVFSKQGHSGFSAPWAVSMFAKLAKYEVLSPLTGEESEWGTRCDKDQNKRCSAVFRNPDGSAYHIYGKLFEEPSGSRYSNARSHTPVTFPYTPVSEIVKVDAEGVPIDVKDETLTESAFPELAKLVDSLTDGELDGLATKLKPMLSGTKGVGVVESFTLLPQLTPQVISDLIAWLTTRGLKEVEAQVRSGSGNEWVSVSYKRKSVRYSNVILEKGSTIIVTSTNIVTM